MQFACVHSLAIPQIETSESFELLKVKFQIIPSTIFSHCLHLVHPETRLKKPTAGIEAIRSEHDGPMKR